MVNHIHHYKILDTHMEQPVTPITPSKAPDGSIILTAIGSISALNPLPPSTIQVRPLHESSQKLEEILVVKENVIEEQFELLNSIKEEEPVKEKTFIEEHEEMLASSAQQEEAAGIVIAFEKEIKAAVEIANSATDPVYLILETILPADLLKDPVFSKEFKTQLKNILGYALETTRLLDIGANGLALIYRSKTLADSKDILASLQDRLKFLVDAQPKEQPETKEIIELRKVVIELSTKVKIEEQDLSFQSGDYQLELASSFFKYVQYPVKLIFTSGSSVFITTGIPIIQLTIGIFGTLFTFYKNSYNRTTFTNWDQAFQNYIQKTQLVIDRTTIDSDVPLKNNAKLFEKSAELFKKRETHFKAQIEKIRPRIDELMPAIKEIRRSVFDNLFKEYQEVLNIPEYPAEALNDLAKKLHLDGKSSSEIAQLKNPHSKEETEILFENYMALETDDSLLGSYVDHQKTIEQTTKYALKEMVAKKNQVEEEFSKFKFTQSAATYGIAGVTAIVSISLAVIGLVTTPVAGAGLILIALSVPATLFSLGFMVAAKYYDQLYRPQTAGLTTILTDVKRIIKQIKMAITEYQQTAKEKKVMDTAEALATLMENRGSESDIEYQLKEELAIEAHAQAIEDRNKYQAKIDKWNGKLQLYQKELEHAQWNDFASYAIRERERDAEGKRIAPSVPLSSAGDLKDFALRVAHLKTAAPSQPLPSFGTLEALKTSELDLNKGTLQAFNTAFQITDLDLISPETKALLETFLGLDMKELQKESKENSNAIKNALRKFFVIDNAAYVKFIQKQNAFLKAKIENA